MNKSIILLLGLLVFLLPFGTINTNNSNAMAFEDYHYEADRYEQYAKNMANENYYKSQGSDFIKKIKCNNINDNLNNVDISSELPNGNDAIAEAQAEDQGIATTAATNGWENSERNDNDFRFVCINNNDNENNVIVVNETTPLPPEPDLACEECFGANSALQTEILDSLIEFDGLVYVYSPTPPNTGLIMIAPGTNTIEQLCDLIESSAEFYGLPVTDVLLEELIFAIIGLNGGDPTTLESEIDALIECLLEAGILVEGEPLPPPDSIFANSLASANIQCTGDPLCAKMEQQ
jgi:hypothetical protein